MQLNVPFSIDRDTLDEAFVSGCKRSRKRITQSETATNNLRDMLESLCYSTIRIYDMIRERNKYL